MRNSSHFDWPHIHHQLMTWLENAKKTSPTPNPNAMTLATVDADGRPHARVVLLKEVTDQALVFYTNYQSAKGRELAHNSHVALTFHWDHLDQQLRIEGTVTPTSRAESASYWATRPRASQAAQSLSQQSQALASYEELEAQYQKLLADSSAVFPCPPHWGGFAVQPNRIEFWTGHKNRLHQRELFEKINEHWQRSMLYP